MYAVLCEMCLIHLDLGEEGILAKKSSHSSVYMLTDVGKALLAASNSRKPRQQKETHESCELITARVQYISAGALA